MTSAPTTLAVAELDDDRAATYKFHTAETSAITLTPAIAHQALLGPPAALHIGTLGLVLEPVASVLEAAIQTIDSRTLVMVDPNCRPHVIIDRQVYIDRLIRILSRADIAKVSSDDLMWLFPDRRPSDAARALLDLGPSVVLWTDG